MASKKFIVDIDLNKNQLLNAVVQNLATAPTSPNQGQIYYNTADTILYGYNGTAWINLMASYTHPTVTGGALTPILSGSNVLATFETNTEGHVIAATTRVLTLADLGYTAYSHPTFTGNDLGAALTGAAVISDVNVNAAGHVIGFSTRSLAAADIGAAIINDAVTNSTNTWSSSKIEAEITAAFSGVPTPTIEGYDVALNTPDLEAPAAGAIKKGDIYVATTVGDFFTETLAVGDTLISKIDNPAGIGNWIRIERNIPDIVNATTVDVGISRFATQAEVDAGILDNVGVAPSTLAAKLVGLLKSYSVNVGDGVATAITVTHNLGTLDVQTSLREGNSEVGVAWTAATINTVQLNFNTAPTADQFRVTIQG